MACVTGVCVRGSDAVAVPVVLGDIEYGAIWSIIEILPSTLNMAVCAVIRGLVSSGMSAGFFAVIAVACPALLAVVVAVITR